MNMRKTIGHNIKILRTAKGWSQEKLAIRSRLSISYTAALERGEVNVSVDSLVKVAKSLEVETHVLLMKLPNP